MSRSSEDLSQAGEDLATMRFCPSRPDQCDGCEWQHIGEADALFDFVDALVLVEALREVLPKHSRWDSARWNLTMVGHLIVSVLQP